MKSKPEHANDNANRKPVSNNNLDSSLKYSNNRE